MNTNKTIQTWSKVPESEDSMTEDHAPFWRCVISNIEENNFTFKNVLDFGCNQGGFLRMLYTFMPFHFGMGVDIAEERIEQAKANSSNLPILFGTPDLLKTKYAFFDLAFSHEVLYLIDDLDSHARQISASLKQGCPYYAAIGCHTDNPQWEQWAEIISSYSNIPVQNYSLDDYADAFHRNGFHVSAKKFNTPGFIKLGRNSACFPKVKDSLDYHSDHKILFCFRKTHELSE